METKENILTDLLREVVDFERSGIRLLNDLLKFGRICKLLRYGLGDPLFQCDDRLGLNCIITILSYSSEPT